MLYVEQRHHIADGVPAVLGKLGLEMRAQAEGLAQERLQVSPIPQGLAGRGQLELEGEADGAKKAVERSRALIAHRRSPNASNATSEISPRENSLGSIPSTASQLDWLNTRRISTLSASRVMVQKRRSRAPRPDGSLKSLWRATARSMICAPHLILEHLDTERRMAT